MSTVAFRLLLKGLPALAAAWATTATAQAGQGRESAIMAVSLKVLLPGDAPRPSGERFVTGKGARSACKENRTCAEPTLPTLTFGGAANSGTRKQDVRRVRDERPR